MYDYGSQDRGSGTEHMRGSYGNEKRQRWQPHSQRLLSRSNGPKLQVLWIQPQTTWLPRVWNDVPHMRKNHFAACCQNFGGDSVKYVHLSTEQEQDVTGEGSSQCVNTVATNDVLNVITTKLMLDGKMVKFQVDSGATCEVVRLKDLRQDPPPPLI